MRQALVLSASVCERNGSSACKSGNLMHEPLPAPTSDVSCTSKIAALPNTHPSGMRSVSSTSLTNSMLEIRKNLEFLIKRSCRQLERTGVGSRNDSALPCCDMDVRGKLRPRQSQIIPVHGNFTDHRFALPRKI